MAKIPLHLVDTMSKHHLERYGKKMAKVIIGEDAFSDDEYIIYNHNDYAFQAKIKFAKPDDPCLSRADSLYLDLGYAVYDIIWQGNHIPKDSIKQKIMAYVEEALEHDMQKANI